MKKAKISTEDELLDLWTGGWRQIWVRFSVEWLERLSRKVLQSTFTAELPSFLPSMQHREKLTSYFLDRWMSALNNFNVISNFFHSHSIQSLMRDLLGFWKTYLRFLDFVHSSGLSILLWLGCWCFCGWCCWCFCGWWWLWRPCFCHKQQQQYGGGLVDAEQCRREPSTALWSFYLCLCLFLYLQLYF